MSTTRTIPCPVCKKPVGFTDPEMPFCSERCRLIDLGAWASEKYVISTPADPNAIQRPSPEDSDDDEG